MTITTALRVYEYFVPVQYLYLAEKNYFLYRLTLAVRTSSLRTSTSTVPVVARHLRVNIRGYLFL